MIKGKTTKLRFNRKTYEIGEPFSGLSEKEEASLVASGIAEYEHTVAQKVKQTKQDDKLIPEGNVDYVAKYIATIEDIELLKKLMEEETADKKRKTVLEAISKRASELSKEDANGEDNNDNDHSNTNPEDTKGLVGNFNVGDTIITGAQ
ncbi:MAG: hypothetical protein K0R80_1607 [Clostridia bacterium]|jgi:hypothetical protein|nr:hypothetical protein [Clostridia bacterium]